LRKTLEHVFSTIEQQEDFTPPLLIGKALEFMRENLHRDISRDETARHAGISPSYFSRLLKERTGRSFTELLRPCRVDLARDLLRGTENSVTPAGRTAVKFWRPGRRGSWQRDDRASCRNNRQ
jgi:AraC-like DNA-binding protein